MQFIVYQVDLSKVKKKKKTEPKNGQSVFSFTN